MDKTTKSCLKWSHSCVIIIQQHMPHHTAWWPVARSNDRETSKSKQPWQSRSEFYQQKNKEQQQEPGRAIEPLTFQYIDEQIYLLSHSRPKTLLHSTTSGHLTFLSSFYWFITFLLEISEHVFLCVAQGKETNCQFWQLHHISINKHLLAPAPPLWISASFLLCFRKLLFKRFKYKSFDFVWSLRNQEIKNND